MNVDVNKFEQTLKDTTLRFFDASDAKYNIHVGRRFFIGDPSYIGGKTIVSSSRFQLFDCRPGEYSVSQLYDYNSEEMKCGKRIFIYEIIHTEFQNRSLHFVDAAQINSSEPGMLVGDLDFIRPKFNAGEPIELKTWVSKQPSQDIILAAELGTFSNGKYTVLTYKENPDDHSKSATVAFFIIIKM